MTVPATVPAPVPEPARTEPALLGPTATREDAARLVDAAREAGCVSVCLASSFFPLRGVPEDVAPVTVAGYPTGKQHPLVKASEAHMAVANGAAQAYVVLDAANAVRTDDGDLNALVSEIVTLREAVPYPAVLRVGVSPDVVLTDGQAATLFRAAATAGADAVVASTPDAVRAMVEQEEQAAATPQIVAQGRTPGDVQDLRNAGAARVVLPVGGADDLRGVFTGA